MLGEVQAKIFLEAKRGVRASPLEPPCLDAETVGSTRFKNPRARGCSALAALGRYKGPDGF